MNSRQRKELQLLIEHGSYSLDEFADLFSLSKRQIRYDINELNSVLEPSIGSEAISICRNIAYLHASITSQSLIKSEFLDDIRDFTKNPLSVKERILLTAFYIAWSSERYVTMQEIADNFSVSYDTIVRDMAGVRKYYLAHNTELISEAGKGLYLKANESIRREILSALVKEYKNLSCFHMTFDPYDYEELFPLENLKEVAAIVSDAEAYCSILLDDASFEAIIIHILFSVKRFKGIGDKTTSDNNLLDTTNQLDEVRHKIASYIVEQVNDYFEIKLPDDELLYIGLHVGLYGWRVETDEPQVNTAVELACAALISAVDSYVQAGFKQDTKLYTNLVQHIATAANRKTANLALSNPLREELLTEYSDLYKIICQKSNSCGLTQLINPTEDELSYILVHFGASLARIHRAYQHKPRVAVVCATGIGTAELLASRLQQQFSLDIVSILAAHHLSTIPLNEVDLIISTLPPNVTKVTTPWLKVGPLLDKEDCARVAAQLSQLGFHTKQDPRSTVDMSNSAKKLQKILQQYPRSEDEPKLLAALQAYVEDRKKETGEKGGEDPMLSDLLSKDHIILDVSCNGWQSSVEAAGQPLVKTGEITPAYIDEVIKNITEHGPYVVITKGIALAHASSTIGVCKTGMALARLKTPVIYGNTSNDPVKYVFMLASTGPETHMTALQCLSELLQDEASIACMAHATRSSEITEQIKHFEKTMTVTIDC
ncbi:BglG family transcription antiterminator [Atopobium fossor]|uniref:BglG family transcription antiterminator n=1 Tax=Atopobium fossor TaxID=39487 RepID=UPI0004053EBA|nr:BglG family transcription antiterminator [Atopobium fossor]